MSRRSKTERVHRMFSRRYRLSFHRATVICAAALFLAGPSTISHATETTRGAGRESLMPKDSTRQFKIPRVSKRNPARPRNRKHRGSFEKQFRQYERQFGEGNRTELSKLVAKELEPDSAAVAAHAKHRDTGTSSYGSSIPAIFALPVFSLLGIALDSVLQTSIFHDLGSISGGIVTGMGMLGLAHAGVASKGTRNLVNQAEAKAVLELDARKGLGGLTPPSGELVDAAKQLLDTPAN